MLYTPYILFVPLSSDIFHLGISSTLNLFDYGMGLNVWGLHFLDDFFHNVKPVLVRLFVFRLIGGVFCLDTTIVYLE